MIRPMRDVLVLRPLTRPGMVGLIVIPDSGRQRDKTGGYCEVVAAGPKSVLAKEGAIVHVTAYGDHYAGEEFQHEGETLVLIRERDINGVVCHPHKLAFMD